MELEDYKTKVQMAEKIIFDLRQTGNESLNSLITMLTTYKTKEREAVEEIEKLKSLIHLKDNEITNIDQDIMELTDYVGVAKERLQDKVE
jgi:plasmid replication initiation protein